MERGTKRGESAFEQLSKNARSFIGPGSALAYALTAVNQHFQELEERARAIREEAARTGEAAISAGAAIGGFAYNRPGVTAGEIASVEKAIVDILRDPNVAIGAAGADLAQGFTAGQGAIPSSTIAQLAGAVRQSAIAKTVDPQVSIEGMTVGIAKLSQTREFAGNDVASRRFLQSAQSLSAIPDASNIADSMARLTALSDTSKLDPFQNAAALAMLTQTIQDKEGAKATTGLEGVFQNVMMRGPAIGSMLGIDVDGPDAFSRLRQIIPALRGADETTRGKAITLAARGGAGKSFINSLVGEGGIESLFSEYDRPLRGSVVGEDPALSVISKIAPGIGPAGIAFADQQSAARAEAGRLDDPRAMALDSITRAVGREFERMNVTDFRKGAFFKQFEQAWAKGLAPDVALSYGLRNFAASGQPGARMRSKANYLWQRGRNLGDSSASTEDLVSGDELTSRLIATLENLDATNKHLADSVKGAKREPLRVEGR